MSGIKSIEPGTRFGRLTVVRRGEMLHKYGRAHSTSVCRCDCGRVITIENYRLKSKRRHQVSCGCARYDPVNRRKRSHAPIVAKNYRYVYCPTAGSALVGGAYAGYVLEHRLVVEQAIGRPLRKDEVVHHIDFNKQNNVLSNLIVLSNAEHAILHAKLRKGILAPDAVCVRENLEQVLRAREFRHCADCGKLLSVGELSSSKTTRCVSCYRKHARKVTWPSREELLARVSNPRETLTSVASSYGVSIAAMKKWMRHYGIVISRRKPGPVPSV